MSDDGELFRRSLREPAAFAGIFERHAASVLSYVRGRIGANAAEEVVSETFLIAFQRRARFDPSYGSARPWLLGIATNLIRHHLRAERAHLEAIGKLIEPSPIDGSDDVARLDAQRMRPALIDALLSLSVADRETFLLIAVGGLTYEETAAALGVPVGTVRSRVHRARALLRERIQGIPAITEGNAPPTRKKPWTNSI